MGYINHYKAYAATAGARDRPDSGTFGAGPRVDGINFWQSAHQFGITQDNKWWYIGLGIVGIGVLAFFLTKSRL